VKHGDISRARGIIANNAHVFAYLKEAIIIKRRVDEFAGLKTTCW